MRGVCLGTFVFLVVATMEAAGQELTNVVIPSADEVYEALAEGYIDYEQYVALLEFVEATGTAKAQLFQSDLPNGAGYHNATLLRQTNRSPVESSSRMRKSHSDSTRVSMKYQYYTTLTDTPTDRYSITGDYRLTDHWSLDARIKRDQSGRERITSRRVDYKTDAGSIRELELGSFVESYGLGTVIGSRNKVLKFEGSLNTESLLFPDCGGFNGVNITTLIHDRELASILSFNRDTSIELLTWGAMIRSVGAWRRAIIVGVNQVTERRIGHRNTDMKAALNLSHGGRNQHLALEYCFQFGERPEWVNVVVDGMSRTKRTSLKYAGWHYGRDFVDVSSGSIAAPIRNTYLLDEVDFSFANKRAGQTGIQFQGEELMTRWLSVGEEIMIGARDHDSTYIQFQPDIEIAMPHGWSARVDYLETRQTKLAGGTSQTSVKGKVEFETRLQSDKSDFRLVLGHARTLTQGDFVSILLTGKHEFDLGRKCEFWSNIGRMKDGRIDYWYGYVKTSQPLSASAELGLKIIHRYRRDTNPHHETAATLELSARL